jgi:hypothetical protein
VAGHPRQPGGQPAERVSLRPLADVLYRWRTVENTRIFIIYLKINLLHFGTVLETWVAIPETGSNCVFLVPGVIGNQIEQSFNYVIIK